MNVFLEDYIFFLEKFNTIFDIVSPDVKKKFDSKPAYN